MGGHVIPENDMFDEEWWNIYDKLWILISEMHGKGPSKLPRSSSSVGPSFGQRARGLVESLNILLLKWLRLLFQGELAMHWLGK